MTEKSQAYVAGLLVNSNTEYVPRKCRITRPPPPKPATNPLQFVKLAPPPLVKKAQEQVKKVEEIKKERKEIRDETEDWQQNLDNWKSCRRKRQEHIIERVVEVKKLTEQEELEKSRRKCKTFSEMLKERSHKGRPKVTIPVYNDDDSNNFSDYGICSSSSKANSVKDDHTDDSSSLLDEKDDYNLQEKQKNPGISIQSEDETTKSYTKSQDREVYVNSNVNTRSPKNVTAPEVPPKMSPKSSKPKYDNSFVEDTFTTDNSKQYTYEGAIEDYRSRIQKKIKVDEYIFSKKEVLNRSKEYSEAQSVLPKGEISKRKGLFESSKSMEIGHMEYTSCRRVSEDFVNARSLKDRLKSLESATDQSLTKIDKSEFQVSVKDRLASFNRRIEPVNKELERSKISSYSLDKSVSTPSFQIYTKPERLWKASERSSSPEAETYLDKLDMFHNNLNNLMGSKSVDDNIGDYCTSNATYPPSTSSVDLAGVLSDREDSGIHTADVSCSVSQADEPIDTYAEAIFNTIPSCIEKLQKTEEQSSNPEIIRESLLPATFVNTNQDNIESKSDFTRDDIIDFTKEFLDSLIKDATLEIANQDVAKHTEKALKKSNSDEKRDVKRNGDSVSESTLNQDIEFRSLSDTNFLPIDIFTGDFPLTSTKLQPPNVRPPPPPPVEDGNGESTPKPLRRLNSTKRIKKEINSKRSSFLGLDQENAFDNDQIIEKSLDYNSYQPKETKQEKSLYRKILDHESNTGSLSKVESQDSGLDIDRGRLSSDTWCSSVPSHDRQDSEHTNSITSEEDEITKKEREIIEMVEKEEKSKSKVNYISNSQFNQAKYTNNIRSSEHTLGSEKFCNPYYPEASPHYIDDQDSEVLKVERELQQLEQEELERQRENIIFRESRNRARLANRHSLENICDDIYPHYSKSEYRKSLPDLSTEFQQSAGNASSSYYENIEPIKCMQSTPDIQHAYQSSAPEQRGFVRNNRLAMDHRKSMPELKHDSRGLGFTSPPTFDRQPIKPSTKPLRTIPNPKPRILAKPNLKQLSAIPKNRHPENWAGSKATPPGAKSYSQHWVIQEAELRRLSEHHQKATSPIRSSQHEKPLPDSVIQTITQRVQNRSGLIDRAQPRKRIEPALSTDYNPYPIYVNHPQAMGHAMPSGSFCPQSTEDIIQDTMLSVSGKKKCSYCNTELGRGAAMIIESLCLFYHMKCFKCCVCHIELGDGRIGTDVRVRNQKLHCHNCYSSDDGVKFSCV
ncbi:hypothetical protein HUJ05_002805 [Dendroctonus ponderosae]|nr:hypothetical protein HUJ05_002805 [Dendroctonus ponderosae]